MEGMGCVHKRMNEMESFNLEGMQVIPFLSAEETQKFSVYHIVIPQHHRVPQSYHKVAHELILFLEGRGFARVNGRRFPVAKGEAIWILPGIPHGFETQDGPLTLLAILSPRVDTKTDFYYVEQA